MWIAESRNANDLERALFPSSAKKGHKVVKFSPAGEVLLTIGTPGDARDPPTHLNEPMGIAVAANGDIFIAERLNIEILTVALSLLKELTVDAWPRH